MAEPAADGCGTGRIQDECQPRKAVRSGGLAEANRAAADAGALASTSVDFTYLALQLGLEVYRFQARMELTSHLHHIAEDQASGAASGVRGTPTFFINGCRYHGLLDTASLVEAIKDCFNAQRAGDSAGNPSPAVHLRLFRLTGLRGSR